MNSSKLKADIFFQPNIKANANTTSSYYLHFETNRLILRKSFCKKNLEKTKECKVRFGKQSSMANKCASKN